MPTFQEWLNRRGNKIGLFDEFLTRGGGGKRSRMSTRPMMWEDEALEAYTGEQYNNAMLKRGIQQAVDKAFGTDRETRLSQENQLLRGALGQQRQATGGLARDLQRVGGEKQGVTSPELDPYQMARQIPGMERKGAMTTVAGGGGGGSNMDMVGMDPMAGSPEVATGTGLPVGAMDTGATLMPPTAPDDEYVSGLASGGPLQRGAVHMVGEAGRELVVPRGDGGYQVIPHRMTEAVMARNPQMRVEGHADGDPIPPYEPYDWAAQETLQRPVDMTPTPPYAPAYDPWERPQEAAGERPWLGRPGFVETPAPQPQGMVGRAAAGAEGVMPPEVTAPAPAPRQTSVQLARPRPVTLIRGTNVTYANPSVTGEQEFSTPQMAREASMYTPEAQAEMFELKRQAARQAVENLGTSPAADARLAAVMARENSAWGRAKAQVEATSAKDNNGIPTLTIDRNGNTIVHPRHLPKAIGDITSAAPKVQTVNDGIQLAEQIRQTVSGHDPATRNRAFEALLGPIDNPGAGALPANVAKQVREYYARLRQQAATQQAR